jgi:hypothetical protein
MKTILLLMFTGVSAHVAAQQPAADSLYIVTYVTGTAWDTAKPPHEQPYFKEHSANLSKLRKEGVIKAGARYAEKGIIFISATSLQHAQEIIFSDQAVINKLFIADVERLNVFYDGCIEKPKK